MVASGCTACSRKDAQLAIAVTIACLAVGGLIGLALAVLADQGKLHIPHVAVAVVRRVPDHLPDQGVV